MPSHHPEEPPPKHGEGRAAHVPTKPCDYARSADASGRRGSTGNGPELPGFPLPKGPSLGQKPLTDNRDKRIPVSLQGIESRHQPAPISRLLHHTKIKRDITKRHYKSMLLKEIHSRRLCNIPIHRSYLKICKHGKYIKITMLRWDYNDFFSNFQKYCLNYSDNFKG